MRTIGLIGGMSWESSAEYYRLINQQVRDRLGPLRSAQMLMYSVDFGPVEQAQHAGRWDDAAAILVDAARRLRSRRRRVRGAVYQHHAQGRRADSGGDQHSVPAHRRTGRAGCAGRSARAPSACSARRSPWNRTFSSSA